VDDFKGHFEGVGRLYQQIDEKISEKGGLMNLFGLHGKLRESLEAITAGELDALLSEIHRSTEALNRLQKRGPGAEIPEGSDFISRFPAGRGKQQP
jgi:hypothetical protein